MNRRTETRLSFGPRRVWGAITVGLLVMSVLEVWVGHLIVTRLLGPPVSTAVDVLLVVATVVLTAVMASPLWASGVRLTEDELVLDLAGLGRARVPLASIVSVAPDQPSAWTAVPPGAVVDGDPPVATFSLGAGSGYVRVRLDSPILVRHSLWRRAPASQIVLRLDDPDHAVAAILAATRPGG